MGREDGAADAWGEEVGRGAEEDGQGGSQRLDGWCRLLLWQHTGKTGGWHNQRVR